MKAELLKENLINNIALAEKVSGKNLTLPVLNCVVLEAEKSTLKIKATNLDLGIEIELPAKVEKTGTVAVPGALFHSIVANTQADKILLEMVGDNLSITTKLGKTLVKAYPNDDFPTLPRIDSSSSFSIKSTDIIKGIQSVWYSASTSAIKPELSSVYIYHHDGKLYFVATDSFRLAEKIINADTLKNFEQILIPFKNIPEILRVLEQTDDTVDIKLNNNQISFIFDRIYLTSRLIDGTFPDYKQIIPKNFTTEAVLLKQDIVGALKKTMLFSDTFNQVHFRINPSKKVFSLSSKNAETGETVDAVPGALSGESIEININYKYIMDCFQSIHSDSVSFSFAGLSKPILIKGVSDNSFQYIVMPMNK